MKLYRYRDICNEQGMHIIEDWFKVIKKTPSGFWVSKRANSEILVDTPEEIAYHLQIERGSRVRARFVLSGPGKRFCHESKALAMHGFMKRKAAQARRAKSTLAMANQSLKASLNLLLLGDCLPRCKWTGSIMAGMPPEFKDYTWDL